MASQQDSRMQYQHFIPRFILKNFSHSYRPKKNDPNIISKRGRKYNKNTKLFSGDQVLNVVDLKDEVPILAESPIKRTFGLMDMYRDASNTTNHNHLEEEFSKLESRAGSLIASIKKALDSGKQEFEMKRPQRNMLRKFLFLMKYRGKQFHQRFHGDESGNYDEDDKECLKDYMQKSGILNPVDVWLRSIKTILELEMDLEGNWMKKLPTQIYPDDAKWFIMHAQMYYLAFCTPKNPKDEFILTENCYNVHEGPNSGILNPNTGEHEVNNWTSYHEFTPITPKLMLVLRSFLLPNPEEDTNENIKAWRKKLYETNCNLHSNPAAANSILKDLPIKKARNSYTRVTAEGIHILPGEDGSQRSCHRFIFSFFKINTGEVYKINSLLLENAHVTSTIVFNAKIPLKESLEYYFKLPADFGFKVVLSEEQDVQLKFLKKLQLILKSLGSNVDLTYKKVPGIDDILLQLEREAVEQWRKFADENWPEQPTEFMQLYCKLGGSRDALRTDLDQVGKMRWLRIKVDVWTQGLDEAIREKIRNNLKDIFCQLPARRLWMYLKQLRTMSLGSPETFDERSMDGPEDVIAKVSQIVRPECLGLLLHFTVMQDIQHRKYPGLNPSSDFTLDEAGLERVMKITSLAFAPVGKLCNCGIKPIQEAAMGVSLMIRDMKLYEKRMDPRWNTNKNIELLTRATMRGEMDSILSKQLSKDIVQELSDVLFNIVYPTYRK